MREKEGYRENIALLNARFPDKDMLGIPECMEFMGCSRDTVKRRIRFNGQTKRITKSDFARQITAP